MIFAVFSVTVSTINKLLLLYVTEPHTASISLLLCFISRCLTFVIKRQSNLAIGRIAAAWKPVASCPAHVKTGRVHNARNAGFVPTQNCPRRSGSHLIHVSLSAHLFPIRHIGRFIHFYTAHPCAQHTDIIDTQITLRATSVAIYRVGQKNRTLYSCP